MDRVEFQTLLIEKVKQTPILYDFSRGDYSDYKKRQAAFKQIADELLIGAEELKRQWKTLRDHYCREKKKMQQKSTDEGRRVWELFEHLSFLEPFVYPRPCTQALIGGDDNSRFYDPDAFYAVNATLGHGVACEQRNPDAKFDGSHYVSATIDIADDDDEEPEYKMLGVATDSSSPGVSSYDATVSSSNAIAFSAVASNKVKRPRLVSSGLELPSHCRIGTPAMDDDEDELFTRSIAASLRKMQPKQKSLAKLKILQAMHEVQFE